MHSYVMAGTVAVLVWCALLLLLLLVGWLLSRATMRIVQRATDSPTGQSGLKAWLRLTYRAVLTLCGIFYYLSLPLLTLLVLFVGGGLIYLMLEVGHLPIRLFLVVLGLTLVTLWAILRSVLIRSRDVDPGMKLNPAMEPKLEALLHEVAGRVGTRPVDNVYVTPGTDMAVMERGGAIRRLRRTPERCLILGIAVLEGMALGPFKAVLAHEYGHFSNRDTAGGALALSVRRSITTMAARLARGGAAAWYNPAWLFVHGFYRVFLRISQGASRFQEIMADRWSAILYGPKAFEEGLRHVIARSIQFNAHAQFTLKEILEAPRPLSNFYAYKPRKALTQEKLSEALEKAVHATTSPYDSHPSPGDRFKLLEALPIDGIAASAEDRSPAWSLFSNRVGLEGLMTERIRENVHARHGVLIPRPEAANRA
jgi:Zn-dependent protease with chaperone function